MSLALEEAREKRSLAYDKMEDWDAKIQALPVDADQDEVDFLNQAFETAQAEFDTRQKEVERQEVLSERRAKALTSEAGVDSSDHGRETRHAAGGLRVREPLTYERRNGQSFFHDLYYAGKGNLEPQQRLQRHAREVQIEMRALNSTDTSGGEFVPPIWMQSEWVNVARAGRPFANAMNARPLPPNTDSINLPVLTSGGAVATQSDGGPVQSTDPVTASVNAPVRTIAGQIDMSRQLFERSLPGLDEVLFEDLARDYATKLDVQCISGLGTGSTAKGALAVSGIIAVTFTSAAPTVSTLYPKFADAIQQIHTNLFMSPDAIFMHPRRWGWHLGAIDSAGRPLVSAVVPQNALARFDQVGAENIVGQVQGIPVILDASLPTTGGAGTNQDTIIVARMQELYLFEEAAPRSRVFEEVLSNTLQIRIQVFGYFACLADRYPKAIASITGTGLVPPTF